MRVESDDPRDVDVLVVHRGDVITALAATAQGNETVLRLTPPFHGRQRARIHVPVTTASPDAAVDKPATDKPATDKPATDEPATDRASTAGDDKASTAPIQVPAHAFVTDDAPWFPEPDDTTSTAQAAPAYDPDEHLERHQEAITAWRATIEDCLTNEIRMSPNDADDLVFGVRYLGSDEEGTDGSDSDRSDRYRSDSDRSDSDR